VDTKTNLTDAEKLKRLKKIIEENLNPIFTSFTLDFNDSQKENSLEKYVEMKELLNITKGVSKKDAIMYDNFKKSKPQLYDNLINQMDNRILTLKQTHRRFKKRRLSTFMFMSAFYYIHCNKLSQDMDKKEYERIINDIGEYRFTSG